MAKQIPLFKSEPTGPPKPDAQREHPAVWVRELAIFNALKPGDESVVRRIKLRLGLNILWAKPEDSSKPARLHESGLSGHASGKTTFCRMLRHVLGEKHFANDVITASIREKFDGGWLAGEVVVDGQPWAVFRPFTLGARPFAVKGSSIDEVLAGDPPRVSFGDYVEAVEEATAKKLPIQKFSVSGEPIEWQHLLEWLSRDQECRLILLTDWRSKLSMSDAPDIQVDDQHALMRATIGLLDEAERAELQNNARLIKEKERSSERLIVLHAQAAIDQRRLQDELDEKLPSLEDRLFIDGVTAGLKKAVADNQKLIRNAASDPEAKTLQKQLEDAVRATSEAEGKVREVEALIKSKQADLDLHRSQGRQNLATAVRGALKPGQGYCAVPIEEARAAGCTLAKEQPIDLASQKVLQSIEDEAPRLEREIQALTADKTSREQSVVAVRTKEIAVRTDFLERQTKREQYLAGLYDQRTEAVNRLRLAQRAHEAWTAAEKLSADIVQLEEDVRKSQKRQEALRKHQDAAVQRISSLYEEIVRAVLGDGVTAAVRLAGRYLEETIERNGDLSSGAIDTIKILAFDIAALAASVGGYGVHPRFLLHDSPREADMAPLTYQRFFLWARKLEQMFPAGVECNFQYIVTTTEPPPAELRDPPWRLEPILDASEASKRLLGIDL
jgi:hypothetical protein